MCIWYVLQLNRLLTVLDEGYLGLRGYKWVKTRMNAPFEFVCRLAVMKGSGDF